MRGEKWIIFSNFAKCATGKRRKCHSLLFAKKAPANDSMRPCKLQRHNETKHPSLVSKPREFCDRTAEFFVAVKMP